MTNIDYEFRLWYMYNEILSLFQHLRKNRQVETLAEMEAISRAVTEDSSTLSTRKKPSKPEKPPKPIVTKDSKLLSFYDTHLRKSKKNAAPLNACQKLASPDVSITLSFFHFL